MTKEPTRDGDRTIETSVEIRAPIEAVWKALTDARELERWFPLKASVRPGVGGAIWLSWGPPWERDSPIEIWEPLRHLRMRWPFHAEKAVDGRQGVLPLAVDYVLEARGDTTILRLVHSGFGRGANWDDEYDGTRRGWTFELGSLARYLELHRGAERSVAWARRRVHESPGEIWPRLFGSRGLIASGAIDGAPPGGRYAITTSQGDALQGEVLTNEPPFEFSGTLDGPSDGVLRVGVDGSGLEREIWLWASLHGESRRLASELELRWIELLASALPDGRAMARPQFAQG